MLKQFTLHGQDFKLLIVLSSILLGKDMQALKAISATRTNYLIFAINNINNN